ncbi:hypothetical protein IJX73_00855 [bacterium]|nr:hypothetical protein [bacterium]MBQ9149458.1 hypothetical protein [bacterium]
MENQISDAPQVESSGEIELDKQVEEILNEKSQEKIEVPKQDIEGETNKKEITSSKTYEKFLKEDGTFDLENLLKSYDELEPLLDEKNQWEKEKAEFQKQSDHFKQIQNQQQAQIIQAGYDNPKEYEIALEVANVQSSEYMKYLHLVEEPDKVRGMLALYAQSPTNELLEQIEDEFNLDVVKKVSILTERARGQIIENTIRREAETFINNSIKDFPDWFKISEFTNFFADALKVKGDNFETSEFIKHIENLKQYFRKEFEAEMQANKENQEDLNSLKKLSPKNTPSKQISKNINDYTPDELDKAIDELV